MRFEVFGRVVGAVLLSLLAACNANNGVTIGGVVSGLGSGLTLVLQNDSTTTLTITGNGAFNFNDGTSAGQSYNVTVLTQPVGQTCTVTNGAGTVDSNGDDVASISVVCSATSSLGGTVTGLNAGGAVTLSATLSDGVTATLPVAANGTFAFNGVAPAGTTFVVAITQQPANQTCTLANATGTIAANLMSSVTVTCQ
jgi:hypothetical protein